MSKNKHLVSVPEVDFSGATLIGPGCSLKRIVGIQPTGSQVLVELLTQQEIYNTKMSLPNKRAMDEFQGFVRGVGPALKLEDWGFKIGDRVVISGGGVPVPNYDKIERERVLMEPHSIKGVLVQEE